MTRPQVLKIGQHRIRRGESADVQLKVSERYSGDPITLPIRVVRARKSGPTAFITAAVHGDELNGMGILHELMVQNSLELTHGTLILVPVVNIFGFEHSDRYMPDRRDLNRSFPGSRTGSLTSRVASIVYEEIIRKCDFGIDLHTAAVRRTNFPNVRADLTAKGIRKLARAFGCELIVNSKGPEGSLRREATKVGVPTILLEAGEPYKIEPSVLEIGQRGVLNVLCQMNMLEGIPSRPAYQTIVEKSTWVRAEVGGILRFHVAPGEPVEAGQAIATNSSVFGLQRHVLSAPVDGVVLGMATLPMAQPGEPVCHVAIPRMSLDKIRSALGRAPRHSPHSVARQHLATNIAVSEQELEPPSTDENGDGSTPSSGE